MREHLYNHFLLYSLSTTIRTPIRFFGPDTDPALCYSVDPDPIELIRSINSYVSTLKRSDTIDVVRETLMRRGMIDAMRGTMMRKAASHDEPHNEELRRECDDFVDKQI